MPIELTLAKLAELAATAAVSALGKRAAAEGYEKARKLVRKDPVVEPLEKALRQATLAFLEALEDERELLEAERRQLKYLVEDPVWAQAVSQVPYVPFKEIETASCRELFATFGPAHTGDSDFDYAWRRLRRGYRDAIAGSSAEPLRALFEMDAAERTAEAMEGIAERLSSKPASLEGDEALYAERMRKKYRALDLSALRPPTAEETGAIQLRDAFVPQNVREDPPAVELPKDLLRRLMEEGAQPTDESGERKEKRHRAHDEHTALQLERAREAYAERSPEPVLEVLRARGNRRIVLLGQPGTGKSTLMRFLLLSALDARGRDSGTAAPGSATAEPLPLLIELRDFYFTYAEGRCQDDFLSYWDSLGRSQGYHLNKRWLDRRLRTGPSLVLFDGLDEIFEAKERKRVLESIVGFAVSYPKARVVVTSRPVGYSDAILRAADFRHYALEDLDDRQIKAFVNGWFALVFPDQPKEAKQRRDRILKATESRAIRLLAGNPMLLTIMAMIAQLRELPRERWRFYEHAVEVLCHHWDVNHELEEEGFADLIGIEDKKELLRRIAFHMQGGEAGLSGNVIREPKLQEEVRGYLRERYELRADEAKRLAKRLIKQLRERNYVLCLRGPGLYGFVHRTFLEYFCAAELVRRVKEEPKYSVQDLRDEVFAEKWRDAEWREVLRLACGMVGEGNVAVLIRFLTAEANPDWRRTIDVEAPANLALSLQCLGEVRNTTALDEEALALVQEILGVMMYLGRWEGQQEQGVLMEQLLPAAEDLRLPKRAREWFNGVFQRGFAPFESSFILEPYAQLVVSWLGDLPTTSELLRERARQDEDGYVRGAALSALARCWPEDATSDLLRERALQDEHYAVRGAALSALARGWPEDATRDLLRERALQDENYGVRRAALSALARCWPEDATRDLLRERALQDEHYGVRNAALSALARGWPEDATRDLLRERALQDDNYGVRSAALSALARCWPEDATRDLLRERALQDEYDGVRSAALSALARGWPEDATRDLLRERALQDEHYGVRSAALSALARGWPEDATRDLLRERALQDEHYGVRRAALSALARGWPEDATRDLLRERALQDENYGVRGVALSALARGWPEDATRDLLRERALQDEHYGVRSAAPSALARGWPEDATRDLLRERALQDEHYDVRRDALSALARGWPEDATRDLLRERALQDEDYGVRRAALSALARGWPEGATRDLLRERALQDENYGVRRAALSALARCWPEDATRDLLRERALQDENYGVRSAALSALARCWPEDATRDLLRERALQDENYGVRRAALSALARGWPEDATRDLLRERVLQDEHDGVRSAALSALARCWPEDATRDLLRERALQDENEYIRRAALSALARGWPEDATRDLLRERALQDEDDDVRSEASGLVARGRVAREALVLMSRDLDGVAPYLDPKLAVARKHLQRGAKRLGLEHEAARTLLASCEEILGWNPLTGAA